MVLRLLLPILLISGVASGAELRIENVRLVDRSGSDDVIVLVDVSWQHARHSERNHDAAWLFFKYLIPGSNARHAKLLPDGHTALTVPGYDGPPATLDVAADSTGLFVYPQSPYRGNVRWRLQLRLDPDAFASLRNRPVEIGAYGVEMVYIPTAPFTLGDPDPTALDFNAFFRSDADGQPDGLYAITSEAAIPVGAQAGALDYRVDTPAYQGDRQGPVPEAFPKGYQGFYIMKYELTQGQYADFLNTLGDESTFERFSFGGRTYARDRGTIQIKDDHYVAGRPDRPLNHAAWDDQLAWADWAACRPMTEFEFTKAARGPASPLPGEFPWGIANRDALARIVGPDDDLIMTNGWDESRLNDSTRAVFGASYYGVLDLAGSVWERVVTPAQADGRAFTGSHGDGNVNYRGRAENPDWPHDWAQKTGHGYRGGGFYEQGMRVTDFNPHSPVAYRRFGAWAGSYPHPAYGFRCVRTTDLP